MPTYYVLGNHDDPKTLNETYPLGNIIQDRHIVLDNWHIILLDSQKMGAVEGFLEESQLKFLTQCLQQYPDHHSIVVFHHQPVPVGSAWLDRLGLTNAAELWAVLKKFSSSTYDFIWSCASRTPRDKKWNSIFFNAFYLHSI